MLRLFAAIELRQLHRNRLALIKTPFPGAKWVDPESMHITLRFAGDIENHAADEFAGFLSEIDFDPFDVQIGEIASFGGNDPRIVFATADGGRPLEQLHRSAERAARSAGLDPETRSFKPHVTLARLKGAKPETVARFLGTCAPLGLPPFRVERFVLFSSRLRVGGGPYVIEEIFEAVGI